MVTQRKGSRTLGIFCNESPEREVQWVKVKLGGLSANWTDGLSWRPYENGLQKLVKVKLLMERNAKLVLCLLVLSLILGAGAIFVRNFGAKELRHWLTPVLTVGCVLVHTGGLAAWARSKGRNPAWALLGIVLLGPLAFLMILELKDLRGSGNRNRPLQNLPPDNATPGK
jgi:hypothetical protein